MLLTLHPVININNGYFDNIVRPNKKIGVVQVTRPYQNAHLNEKINFYAFIL